MRVPTSIAWESPCITCSRAGCRLRGGQLDDAGKKARQRIRAAARSRLRPSPGVNRSIMQCLQPKPDDRPATCGEFLEQLETADGKLPETLPSIELPPIGLPPIGLPPIGPPRSTSLTTGTALHRTQKFLFGAPEPAKETWQGKVVDVSPGGAHLLVESPL